MRQLCLCADSDARKNHAIYRLKDGLEQTQQVDLSSSNKDAYSKKQYDTTSGSQYGLIAGIAMNRSADRVEGKDLLFLITIVLA
jgi:hypothetical protein